jgi:CPA2 family monovalent cation:H+ antiporter-2
LGFAFLGGLIAVRLRLPPLVGYLLAGIAVGPFTPGFVADVKLAPQLAEIGVILLMFGVGLHFSVRDLWDVRKIALPGALFQILITVLLGLLFTRSLGWSLGEGLVLGLALSVASTVVLLRALEQHNMVASPDGRVAVGWLIIEDLMMVLTLVLLPALAGLLRGESAAGTDLLLKLALTLGNVALFVILMLVGGARFFPWLLRQTEQTGVRELFTLAVAAIALAVAFASAKLFGVSFALGAFFAGVVINEADLSHRAAQELQSLQDAFAVLFFVSVGMLFNPAILIEQPVQVLVVVAIILLGKSLAAYLIVRLLRHPPATAWTVAGALAQIGEFSFILAGLGVSLGVLPEAGQSLVLAGALFSITLNPLVFRTALRLAAR